MNHSFTCRERSVARSHLLTEEPHVLILMAAYNGASFLCEQLDSIESQSHRRWTLVVSDDGSTDETSSILDDYRRRWGAERLVVVEGPRRGFVANFLSLVCMHPGHADFYAWSDQDDIWHADKLRAALRELVPLREELPLLYCGRTELVLESGRPVGYSPLFSRAPGFNNALVQNLGGGNTMVFNSATRRLLQCAGCEVDVPSHDWWAYQLVTGAGGIVVYDPQPWVAYRQHGANLVGANSSWPARLMRLRMLIGGRFTNWNDRNLRALSSMREYLTPDNRRALDRFSAARRKVMLPRVLGVLRSGVYRQTILGNMGLVLAALLKRL